VPTEAAASRIASISAWCVGSASRSRRSAPAHDPPVRGDHGADRHLLLGVGDPREGERLPHEGLVGWQEHRP